MIKEWDLSALQSIIIDDQPAILFIAEIYLYCQKTLSGFDSIGEQESLFLFPVIALKMSKNGMLRQQGCLNKNLIK